MSKQGESVIFNKERQESGQLEPCSQEEAHVRLMVIFMIFSDKATKRLW